MRHWDITNLESKHLFFNTKEIGSCIPSIQIKLNSESQTFKIIVEIKRKDIYGRIISSVNSSGEIMYQHYAPPSSIEKLEAFKGNLFETDFDKLKSKNNNLSEENIFQFDLNEKDKMAMWVSHDSHFINSQDCCKKVNDALALLSEAHQEIRAAEIVEIKNYMRKNIPTLLMSTPKYNLFYNAYNNNHNSDSSDSSDSSSDEGEKFDSHDSLSLSS